MTSGLTTLSNELALPGNRNGLGAVHDDWHAAQLWLERLSLRMPPVSSSTLESYKTELRRLRWYVEKFTTVQPSLWTFQDAMAYLSFLTNDAKKHICPTGVRFGQEEWTPFRSKPAASTIANSKKVISSLYSFWQSGGYVSHNPFAGLGRGAAKTPESVRSVAPDLLQLVYDDMERRERNNVSDYLELVRNRFILRLLERTGLRAAEAVLSDMDDIESISDPRTHQMYWSLFIRHGKGGAPGRVLLDDAVMDELKVYRKAFGFDELPTGNEGVGLVLSLRTTSVKDRNGKIVAFSTRAKRSMRKWGEIRRRQTLWDIVKTEFSITATALREADEHAKAHKLTTASTHWLRHTFGTRLVLEGKDIRTVAQAMRHKNLKQTMIYTNQEFLDIARALTK